MLPYARLHALKEKPLLLWSILWAGVMLLYLPAWKGGFMQDFHGWLLMYRDLPFWDIINRKGAGIRSFYQLTQLQLYIWTFLFGTWQFPWFLLFTGLHALNGLLLMRLCSRVFRDFNLPFAGRIAAAGMLIFLFNPSMTEVVIWKACYHYLIGVQIILWVLLWVHRFLHTKESRFAWYACGLFLLSTFTLEIWFTTPLLASLLGAAYLRARLISARTFGRFLRAFILPMVIITAAYFLLYHAYYGIWLAHGAYETPGDASVPKLAGRIWSYEAHLLAGGRFWPNGARQWLYRSVADGSFGRILILVLLFLFGIYAFARFPKAGPRLRISALLAGWSLIALIIILHFGPDELFYVSNDRYLYFTAAFQAMLVAVLTGALLPLRKRLWTGLTAALLLICMTATLWLVINWRRSTKVFWGIQYNYRWDDAPLVLLLNIPCIYNGIGIIHANPYEELGEHLRIFYNRPPKGKIIDVAAYNMQHPHDGAHVSVQDSLHLKVTLNQWGSWWWYRGRGLQDYENEYFSIHYNYEDGLSYMLTLKQRPPGMVLLYSQGMQWRVVDMQNKAEQW